VTFVDLLYIIHSYRKTTPNLIAKYEALRKLYVFFFITWDGLNVDKSFRTYQQKLIFATSIVIVPKVWDVNLQTQ
jgi:hypothetical protein